MKTLAVILALVQPPPPANPAWQDLPYRSLAVAPEGAVCRLVLFHGMSSRVTAFYYENWVMDTEASQPRRELVRIVNSRGLAWGPPETRFIEVAAVRYRGAWHAVRVTNEVNK
jgi:hypothetical protein